MHESIEKNRNGCNLQGALQTLTAINGVIPILHSTPGCGIQSFLANKAGGGSKGYLNGFEIPNTNIFEKQVIFGGTSRLREQIKNTVKIMKGDLFVILSGCEAEMVGDDITAMTQEIIDQGEKAVYYKAPGFKGNQFTGYEGILEALINQLHDVTKQKPEREKGLVNILGVLPGQDIHWQGNLLEIKRILENIGIEANTLFGFHQGVESWNRLPDAELNVVVSKWGLKAAELLKKRYGTPFICIDDVGLTEEEIGHFVNAVAGFIGIDSERTKDYLKREKEKYLYALGQFSDYFFEADLQKTAAIVGDENTVVRYSKFLSKFFGMDIEIAIITDFIGKAEEQIVPETLKAFVNEVYFSRDSSAIHKLLGNSGIELVLGSGLENAVSRQLGIPNYIISYPSFGKAIINRSDIGYAGAVNVLEDLGSMLINLN